MPEVSNKHIFLMTFLACFSLLAAAYYFEYYLYLDPCPLCIMQRIAVLMVGVVALIGFFITKQAGQRIVAIAMALASIFGCAVAGRHVWIQHLPADQVPTCGPGLEYMVETLPWAEVLSVMLRGNGNCADAQWSFLGLAMPTWVLIWFIGFILVAGFVYLNAKTKKS